MRKVIVLMYVATLMICFAGCQCGHGNKQLATCAISETCVECGETFGTTTDKHELIEAICGHPQKGTICNITEGEQLPNHTWIEADCELAKHCAVCFIEEGQALGHEWENATYDKPKTCLKCGMTNGQPLPKPDIIATIISSIPGTFSEYVGGRADNTVYINNVRVEHERSQWEEGMYDVSLYFSGEKVYGYGGPDKSSSCAIKVKVYDKDGYVVGDTYLFTNPLKEGDKFKDTECRIHKALPKGEYKIEIGGR